MSKTAKRFNALLNAMLTKPPLSDGKIKASETTEEEHPASDAAHDACYDETQIHADTTEDASSTHGYTSH